MVLAPSVANTSSMASVRPSRMRSPCSSDALGDLLAVDERAVARAAIAQQVAPVVLRDLGVLARDVGADDLQIGGGAAADEEQRPVEHDDPASLGIADVKTGFAHGRAYTGFGFDRADLHQQAGEVVDAPLAGD